MEERERLYLRDFVVARRQWLSRMQRILTTAQPLDEGLIETISRSLAEQQHQLDALTALLSQEGDV